MTSYPNIALPNSIVIQPQITADMYRIINVTDDPIGKTVIARVGIGENIVNFFTVWSGDQYDQIGQWTDQQLQDEVTAFVLATYPAV